MDKNKFAEYKLMADSIRILSADAVEKASSGHPGMPMGMADIAAVLFAKHMNFNNKDLKWPNRDRFILSNGHGSMLQYSLLHFLKYGLTIDDIKSFRQFNSKTPGHPEYGHTDGVETTTGPLGQGIANAVGMAIAAKKQAAKFGDDIINHKIFVFVGDGCLMEGISHEASAIAGHLCLNNLVVIFDDNNISIDGSTDLSVSEDIINRYKSYGFEVEAINGHDYEAIDKALLNSRNSNKPYFIAAKTKIGFGAPTKESSEKSHGSPLGKEELAGLRTNLGWNHEPFVIPDDVTKLWEDAISHGQKNYTSWQSTIAKKDIKISDFFVNNEKNTAQISKNFNELKTFLTENTKDEATRQSSGNVIEFITKDNDMLLGGSADLTGSNNTKAKAQKGINKSDFSGSYMYYGVREHAMAAIMNGVALYGATIPYSGTFLVFSDYMKPSMRLSALMGQKVIYILTHDSIGVGEDGPTHQPIEHLCMLRSIIGMKLFRPCDAVETMEAWKLAIEHNGPSSIVLTRQNTKRLRFDLDNNMTEKGAYKIYGSDNAEVVLFATGSEVGVTVEAAKVLELKNLTVKVISMPCMELFEAQPDAYKNNLIGSPVVKLAIEAGIKFGWERYIGNDGIFIGMESFGMSAPGAELFKHFGFTSENIVNKVMEKLGR